MAASSTPCRIALRKRARSERRHCTFARDVPRVIRAGAIDLHDASVVHAGAMADRPRQMEDRIRIAGSRAPKRRWGTAPSPIISRHHLPAVSTPARSPSAPVLGARYLASARTTHFCAGGLQRSIASINAPGSVASINAARCSGPRNCSATIWSSRPRRGSQYPSMS